MWLTEGASDKCTEKYQSLRSCLEIRHLGRQHVSLRRSAPLSSNVSLSRDNGRTASLVAGSHGSGLKMQTMIESGHWGMIGQR